MSIVQTYSIKDLEWKQYRHQLEFVEFGMIGFETRSQEYKVINHKYNLIYDSSRCKCGPEDYVAYESYFFSGDEYNKLKVFWRCRTRQSK